MHSSSIWRIDHMADCPRQITSLVLICLSLACGSVAPTHGGGFIPPPEGRPVQASDVAMSPGFRIEAIATGLSFPTGVTFDDQGRIYVVESGYSYGEAFLTPRLVRIEPHGR